MKFLYSVPCGVYLTHGDLAPRSMGDLIYATVYMCVYVFVRAVM